MSSKKVEKINRNMYKSFLGNTLSGDASYILLGIEITTSGGDRGILILLSDPVLEKAMDWDA